MHLTGKREAEQQDRSAEVHFEVGGREAKMSPLRDDDVGEGRKRRVENIMK
jgi:hypothetical protein